MNLTRILRADAAGMCGFEIRIAGFQGQGKISGSMKKNRHKAEGVGHSRITSFLIKNAECRMENVNSVFSIRYSGFGCRGSAKKMRYFFGKDT
jgi:hypothetical protein